ncbi:hypothetical protein A2U01_0084938, partial [Trifolium medium]|nr:hypothetical protein [Trifolium medium]
MSSATQKELESIE